MLLRRGCCSPSRRSTGCGERGDPRDWHSGSWSVSTAAKYIGIVLLPLAFVVPLIAPIADLRRYFAALISSAGMAVVVFAPINAPAFLTPGIFVHGLNTEIAHALSNHIIVWQGWYSFSVSLDHQPVGRARTRAGGGRRRQRAAGRGQLAVEPPSDPPGARLAVLWYFMHELSPMKPFMAIERHMTVMGGLFAVLAVNLVECLCPR